MAGAPTAAEDSTPSGMPASIPELLAIRRATPDGEFLITDDERLTFAEADTASLELADALLASGVGKGTRVGILFPNCAQWLICWLAAARIGALTVPLSTFAPGGGTRAAAAAHRCAGGAHGSVDRRPRPRRAHAGRAARPHRRRGGDRCTPGALPAADTRLAGLRALLGVAVAARGIGCVAGMFSRRTRSYPRMTSSWSPHRGRRRCRNPSCTRTAAWCATPTFWRAIVASPRLTASIRRCRSSGWAA